MAAMKDFIIIGNANAAISKNVFPLFKDGKVRFGYSKRGMDFDTDEGVKNINAVWYVTFPVKRKPLILTQRYFPAKYPKYDDYDAIDVNEVKMIPHDYDGIMGVPITFLDKYCPTQFEIVGCDEPCINLGTYSKMPYYKELKSRQKYFNGKLCQKTYHRLFIKKVS